MKSIEPIAALRQINFRRWLFWPGLIRRVSFRRIGRFCGLVAAWYAAQDYSDRLARGETAVIALSAPDRKQAALLLDYVRAILTVWEANYQSSGDRHLEETSTVPSPVTFSEVGTRRRRTAGTFCGRRAA
jgi:hypothetical protein